MASTPLSASDAAVALVVRPDSQRALELAEVAREFWERHGRVVLEHQVPEEIGSLDEAKIDLAISLGGDGTMLRTVQLGMRSGALVLGINLGKLGYLTQVEAGAMQSSFEALLRGDYEVEERMTLEVTVHSAKGHNVLTALNEAVVERVSLGHTIRVQSYIDGRPFLSYATDGILVATPTGSTAYNMSLRGPIVSPRMRCLILTPVSPHSLFDRSLVIDPSQMITLEVLDDRPASLVVDGSQQIELEPGDSLNLEAGALAARVVSFGASDFYGVLRAKFGLADR